MSSLMGVMNVAASGMQAATAQLATAANNIANSDTPGYRAERVDLVSLSDNAGVAVAGISLAHSTAAASTSLPPTSANAAPSDVDLTAEVVNANRASVLYTANAKVLATADHMIGTLLDMFDDPRRRE